MRAILCSLLIFLAWPALPAGNLRQTSVSIRGSDFHINGNPTYPGRIWKNQRIEGLLLNARMVQGIFDDRNESTVARWAYPGTRRWDAERNTREFIAAMPAWRKQGLLAFTLNLQGGSPEGYSKDQPWHHSAFESDGSLRKDYLARLEKILDRADQLGMVVILGYFYFGQDERLADEAAVLRATDGATRWLLEHDYRNVLVEINNECNVRYDHPILQPARVHELIQRVQKSSAGRLLVGTSYGGGTIPQQNVVGVSDFLLLHGNGVAEPKKIGEMAQKTRLVQGYRGQPILFNEDDHFDFEKPLNNFVAAIAEHASWGYFDPGKNNYEDGYQSPPVQWAINTPRKAQFFSLLAQITQPTGEGHASFFRTTTYHGWRAIVLSNETAEVVAVPAIGRVMQFRLKESTENPFWENPEMFEKKPDPDSKDWGNFGGDKTWPAPQADWPAVTGRGWPPPRAFDSMPVEARISGKSVVFTSAVDPHFGIRTEREISLDGTRPEMTIVTRYQKISGEPRRVAVWIITQLSEPERIFIPLPAGKSGTYKAQSKDLPSNFVTRETFLSLDRDRQKSTKIGTEAETLVWMGKETGLLIHSPRGNAPYPDEGSSAEVYTNPDPNKYVELEMLGPLSTLKKGDSIAQTNHYRLFKRTGNLDQDWERARSLH